MPVRIALMVDDRAFRDPLTALLHIEGHEVSAFKCSARAWTLSHVEGKTEILITRSRTPEPSVRLRVTSVPTIPRYTGGWSAFLADPVTPDDVITALRNLLPAPLYPLREYEPCRAEAALKPTAQG